MKLSALVLVLAFVAFSHQQLHKARLMPWMTSYSSFVNKYQPIFYDSDAVRPDVPYFRFSRPIRPTPSYLYSLQNGDLALSEGSRENGVEISDEFHQDTQGRMNAGFNDAQGRFFYGTTINNPFYKTATFTVSSTVTTVGSIVRCVPSNNLAASPAPTCNGRRKRESEDPEEDQHQQFPAIAPSETLKLAPTVLLSSENGHHQQQLPTENPHDLLSSKDEGITAVQALPFQAEDQQQQTNNYNREKRLFGTGGIAASTTLTLYSFVGATLTSTVILDPTSKNVAVCLPAGYIICA
ncbi:hypothetical protein DAPPUDRAFT_110217 [Daphnia pulex]|uniref:Uncharacterized protein n=1 Tax=Daphnia pulex TaxID=6669 RepID=E9H5C9_DAPPU|nr:hypothetical protein DAPPUDRAFT_110217 [Daphnia pulex]|eukprot:EFX72936.1 hypothetical protein DAPPUDRAFT_110217 [Daphnia pulex]